MAVALYYSRGSLLMSNHEIDGESSDARVDILALGS